MAAVCRTLLYRSMFLNHNPILTHRVYRYYAVASSKTDDGVLQKVKKFVFGETVSPEQLKQISDSESYYKVMEAKSPPQIFDMEASEIRDRIKSITKETVPISSEQDWLLADTREMVVKYKILKHCYEEFGLEVPSHHLKDINCVKDIVKYYCSMRKPNTKTFESIDMDNLPPNLQIGGKVPRKQT